MPANGRQLGVKRRRHVFGAAIGALFASTGAACAASCAAPPLSIWDSLYDAAGKQLPMQYRVLTPADGNRVLLAKGAFAASESDNLINALAGAGRIDELWLYSGGGNSAAGMEFGRTLRRRGIAVRIPSGAACFSACSMAFLGGPLRSIDPGGYYGVHMWSAWQDPAISQQFIVDIFERIKNAPDLNAATDFVRKEIQGIEIRNADYARQRANYLVEMAVSLRLMHPNTNTASGSEYWVCSDEARSFNVVNVD